MQPLDSYFWNDISSALSSQWGKVGHTQPLGMKKPLNERFCRVIIRHPAMAIIKPTTIAMAAQLRI